MKYISTRGQGTSLSFSDILFEGYAADGGLYVPAQFPKVDTHTLQTWRGLSYASLAFEVIRLFAEEIDKTELWRICAYVPAQFPKVDTHTLQTWRGLSYASLAFEVIRLFAEEIDKTELWRICADTYQSDNFEHTRHLFDNDEVVTLKWFFEVIRLFAEEIDKTELWRICADTYQSDNFEHTRHLFDNDEVVTLKWLHDQVGLLELSNGPSLAFDDIAMQFLARLFEHTRHLFDNDEVVTLKWLHDQVGLLELSNGPSLAFDDIAMQFLARLFDAKFASGRPRTLLGATTGDMGASAEAAFGGHKNIRVIMLSPKDRMSQFQAAQLYSNQDANVENIEINGTFDECQDIVRSILEDREYAQSRGLGAINSVLWARIVAQIVYYFYGYLKAVEHVGEDVVFAVPGGNFGNAYACWVAKGAYCGADCLLLLWLLEGCGTRG